MRFSTIQELFVKQSNRLRESLDSCMGPILLGVLLMASRVIDVLSKA